MRSLLTHPSRDLGRWRFFFNFTTAALLVTTQARCSDVTLSQPTGKSVGSVQFDAIIELNNPSGGFQTLLFVRYWVASNYYHIATAWAEPSGVAERCFPIYAPSLYVGSEPGSFAVRHSLARSGGENYAKPLQERTAFDCMYGDYPVRNLRFAEREATSTRLTIEDMVGLRDLLGGAGSGSIALVLHQEPSNRRQVAAVNAAVTNNTIRSLSLLMDDGRLLKSIEYDYEPDSQRSRLLRQRVFLPERRFMAALQKGSITISIRGQKYDFNAFPITHETGGRSCIVEYQPTWIGRSLHPMPSRITVRDARKQRLIRSAIFTNFRRITEPPLAVQKTATDFASLKPAEVACRHLLAKYLTSPADQISDEDRAAAKSLRQGFTATSLAGLTVGEQLKHLNMLMDINRFLDDSAELERSYQEYLSTLMRNEYSQVVLSGGYNAIEPLILKGRWSGANRLLNCWLKAAGTSVGISSVLSFAANEINRGNLWATFQLLDLFVSHENAPANERFERDALMCLALNGIMNPPTNGNMPELAWAQADWCFSFSQREILAGRLESCVDGARESLGNLKELTSIQKAYLKQLEPIFQRYEVATTQKSEGIQTH